VLIREEKFICLFASEDLVVYKLTPFEVDKWPTVASNAYSPVPNRSAGTITFFLEKNQRGTFIWSGTFWYKSPKYRGLWKKMPILWRKKHSSEPQTKVIFCFVLESETRSSQNLSTFRIKEWLVGKQKTKDVMLISTDIELSWWISLDFAMDLRIPKDCRRSFTLETKQKLAERAIYFKKQWKAERAAPREWNPKTRKWQKKNNPSGVI